VKGYNVFEAQQAAQQARQLIVELQRVHARLEEIGLLETAEPAPFRSDDRMPATVAATREIVNDLTALVLKLSETLLAMLLEQIRERDLGNDE